MPYHAYGRLCFLAQSVGLIRMHGRVSGLRHNGRLCCLGSRLIQGFEILTLAQDSIQALVELRQLLEVPR